MEPQSSTSLTEPSRPPASSYHPPRKEPRDRYWLHALLFVATFCTTVHMGGQLTGRFIAHQELGFWWFVPAGLSFATALLAFLTVHEFGHYFAARHHGISTSLPYYIPLPFLAIGTAGAVIRIREPIPSTRKLFDVGVAGPLAGFVVALGVLLYALATLPPPEYLLNLPGHEPLRQFFEQYGYFPEDPPAPSREGIFVLVVGQTPLYWLLAQLFPNVPPPYEMIHYPVLMAGWFGLFFTALNLLPVGQLDGGHVLYALFGKKWHARLARGFMVVLLLSGAIGFVRDLMPALYAYADWLRPGSWFILAAVLYFFLYRIFDENHGLVAPALFVLMLFAALAKAVGAPLLQFGWSGWLFWSLLIVFFIKVDHPPVVRAQVLTPSRRVLGYLAILIFVLCFSLVPLRVL